MAQPFYTMELKQFKELFTDSRQMALGNDFCVVDVRYDHILRAFQQPVRLDAYLVLFCIRGSVRLNINMKEFDIHEGQFTLMVPGHIGHVVEVDPALLRNLHYVIIVASREYLSSLQLELNRVFAEGAALLESPCITLEREEKMIALRYLSLTSTLLESSLPNKQVCLGQLISSLFYLSEGLMQRELKKTNQPLRARSSRSDEVFNRFLQLLSEHHLDERSVKFYADALCLTPKYFSKLVKNASGRSAPEWIDTFVIMEAKNYLRYSKMSIKQIVYQLHFSDQPTFTKYFKSHTGLTPAQFRKGK